MRVCAPWLLVLSLLTVVAALAVPAAAQVKPGDPVPGVGLDQKLNDQVPLDIPFKDETGKAVRLGDLVNSKPVLLNLIFYKCPGICSVELDGLVEACRKMSFQIGREFDIVTVSINPKEGPELAAAKRQTYLEQYGRPIPAGSWHFLTGDDASIHRLADAVGYRYVADIQNEQFQHPAGLMVLTPQGKLSRYFFTTIYEPRDLRLALIEASHNHIGSLVEKFVLLTCIYHYDPRTGKYGVLISRVLEVACILTLLILGGFVGISLALERRHKRQAARAAAPAPAPDAAIRA